jgi:hypothetical protein
MKGTPMKYQILYQVIRDDKTVLSEETELVEETESLDKFVDGLRHEYGRRDVDIKITVLRSNWSA